MGRLSIRRIGFLLSEPGTSGDDPDDEGFGPHVIDWDTLSRHADEHRFHGH